MQGDNVAFDELLNATIGGRYRIISRLGAGGMGVAYRAWDEQAGVPVVIKIPKRIFLEDPQFAERFYREIRLLQGLKHPHIVPIVGVGEHEGVPFVVMRFLPGGSLSNRRLRDDQGKPRPNPPAMLHLWLPAIAEALDYVHSQGVVHRDVKPANIFFDAFWGAYLGDFGIAKIVEQSDTFDKEHTLTATHMGIGTQEYMAPEQFAPKAVIDGKADQYALAVMVYEILAGKRPFTGETAHLVVEVTTYPVPPIPVTRGDVSPVLVQAVHRALAKQPSQRFATCREFASTALRGVPAMVDEPGVARLLCPQCSNILKLPTAAAGQKGKCPKCQTQMKVSNDLGALWLLDEARKQRKASGVGGDESPSTPGGGVDEKALETFRPISSETPIGPGRPTRLSLPPAVMAGGVAVAAIALLVLAIAISGGSRGKKRLPSQPKPYDARLASALKTLDHDPRDRDANDFVAQHYCFKEGDWKKGLPYLEKSGVSEAAALAKEEIAATEAKPAVPGTLVRLARKWWDYGGRTDLNTPESAAATRTHATDIYSENIEKTTDQKDVDWANQWLDGDKGFAQLVKNLRPRSAAVPEQLIQSDAFTWESNGHRYKAFREKIPWPQAKQRCEEMGGHLVSITSVAEQLFVLEVVSKAGIAVEGQQGIESWAEKLWIGGTDEGSEGKWRWVDGSPWEYAAWVRGQPDADGDFVNICPHIEGQWNDDHAVGALVAGFVCEWPAKAMPHAGVPESAANRLAAEWVLQRGGFVEIEMADKSRKRLASIEELAGLSANREGQAVKAEQRLRWQNEENIDSRLVYHANENVWREEDSKGDYIFTFTERSRTGVCVELFDASREVMLRVYSDKVIYSDAGGNAFELWRGAWVDYPNDAGMFSVIGIELTSKPNVTDQGLACVAQLKHLEWLGVGGTNVTDQVFEHLRFLPSLRGIGVNWTGVSGQGLATLTDAQLKHLEISGMRDPEAAIRYIHAKGVAEWINFDGMTMTPECVRLLGEMKTLKVLHFRDRLIAQDQLEMLRKQLPACRFHIWK